MLKKLFDIHFWKFVLVGVANTLLGSGIMFLFYNVFHLSYWVSSASNYIFGSILSYFLNKYFTFQSRERSRGELLRFAGNITLCYLLAYGAAKPLMRRLLAGAGTTVQDNVAMLTGMCLFVGLNYLGQRFFVFPEKNRRDGPGTEEETRKA